MNTRIVPIATLPPGVAGHLEFTHSPAKRDWRDRAIAVATLITTMLLAMPWVFSSDPVRIPIAAWVIGYVWIASGELKFFTPMDRHGVRAVVELTRGDGPTWPC